MEHGSGRKACLDASLKGRDWPGATASFANGSTGLPSTAGRRQFAAPLRAGCNCGGRLPCAPAGAHGSSHPARYSPGSLFFKPEAPSLSYWQ